MALLIGQEAQGQESPLQKLHRDSAERIRAANARESDAWHRIDSREKWEKYREEKLAALRASLGVDWPPKVDVAKLRTRVTGTIEADGYIVEKIVYESRPGLFVTANLYRPLAAGEKRPAVLLSHSHHSPKSQSELQDMGIGWAKAGVIVLVPDHVGHGERRQHPFVNAASYPKEYRVSRQDYYFRYNVAQELAAAGESLMGWMVWDLMRGVDVLLDHAKADPKRIVLLGGVAGGGDPCAVTAALDPRIAAASPFNFGGPQPETKYPLADDAETSFNYAGGGSWESTRNLPFSARDGFLPWVIVGGIAPRGLIYGHEFSWDRERDPVWKRLEKIYLFYDSPDKLAFAHGFGLLSGKEPEASHCGNIGRVHRKNIEAALQKWFDIPPPVKETAARPAAELLAMTDAAKQELSPRTVREIAGEMGTARAEAYREQLAKLDPAARREKLRGDWRKLLGDMDPPERVLPGGPAAEIVDGVLTDGFELHFEREIAIRGAIMSRPQKGAAKRRPAVIVLGQEGRDALLKHHKEQVDALLADGFAVCIADLRGVGDKDRGRQSGATSLSASELMLGQPMMGSRLKDLRTVIRFVASQEDIDPKRIALWGTSLAKPNGADQEIGPPLELSQPARAEPGAAMLVMLAMLFDDTLAAGYATGGLVSFRSLLDSPFLHVPHDAVVPNAMTAGELADMAATIAPRPLCLAQMVDGTNRAAAAETTKAAYAPAARAYEAAGRGNALTIESAPPPRRWLAECLNAAR